MMEGLVGWIAGASTALLMGITVVLIGIKGELKEIKKLLEIQDN